MYFFQSVSTKNCKNLKGLLGFELIWEIYYGVGTILKVELVDSLDGFLFLNDRLEICFFISSFHFILKWKVNFH